LRRFTTIQDKRYWRCGCCQATLLDSAHFLSREAELAHYRHHENHVDDPRYRTFLGRLAQPLLDVLPPIATGLDYGCGPGPALAAMLGEAGHEMRVFDPFFFPDPSPLAQRYDFIACTEVIEHFHRPADEFDRLGAMLLPGGWLAVMTCFQTDDARFANWHYRHDPTHVVFYREGTLRHLARQRGWSCTVPCKDVALLQTAPP
jgi:SAM-dependent methyltransferase